MSVKEITINRVDLDQRTLGKVKDTITIDEAICIFINNEYFRTLLASPPMKKELVIGHLISEGIINSIKDVKNIEIKDLKIYVELKTEVDLSQLSIRKVNLITTACGSLTKLLENSQLLPLRVVSDSIVDADDVWNMIRELNKRSEVFRKTGGTHSAMLCSTNGEVYAYAEDVGRHNAVDKVLGSGFLLKVDLSKCVLLSSGRQSSEMVLKAAYGGVPIIASVAGPLNSGIQIAQTTGITLLCFVRGRRMNVYTYPQRVNLKLNENKN